MSVEILDVDAQGTVSVVNRYLTRRIFKMQDIVGSEAFADVRFETPDAAAGIYKYDKVLGTKRPLGVPVNQLQ